MRTKIKIRFNAGSYKVVHAFLSYSVPLVLVEDIASLAAAEALEDLLRRFDALKYTQRKSYTFNLNVVTANALCGVFYAMRNAGAYEGVLAEEAADDIQKQIEQKIHLRKYSHAH